MQAICVTPDRNLEVKDIPAPDQVAAGHVLIDMQASAINHGDKTFLKMPMAAGNTVTARRHDVWGASGAGSVVATGAGVPAHYAGRQVAIYRSLGRTPESVGLWCDTAQVPYTSCLILPEHLDAKDYSGSLVNVMTAYAFLEEILEAGHKGVIVTAGGSATGLALASLTRRRNIPAIFLARSAAAAAALHDVGVEHVIVTDEGYTEQLGALATQLGTTAVFDGVGGALPGQIAACLPINSTIYFYGFLGGNTAFSMTSVLFMMKNLRMQRFSNFESNTVTDPARLIAALTALQDIIADPLFRTRIGKEFSYDQIELAMDYQSEQGGKAVLVA